MAERGGEFSSFRGIHAKIDIIIDISISTRPLTTKFGKQTHLEELTRLRLINRVLLTLSRQDHVKN